jgi:hypothetical protein
MARRNKALAAVAAERDRRILAAWKLHEAAEPAISTERLMAMVQGDTGAEPDRQVEALRRAGMFQRLVNRQMADQRSQLARED